MIQRIELWDFESHEHTVLDDISQGLNLICGESNSGKTSLVRALKLVAYNKFDPKSVRIGAKKCVVQVDTDRGRVKVTRGPKDNLWEITRKGQSTQYFDKVGTNIVPDAVEILGLNIVTLGDVEVPVNIMDQLESHFMLSSVGGKDATGSMRAQIIDEISGLSGIESLIKDVSLDRHRFGREITENEKQMEGLRGQLHPLGDLKAEEERLDSAEKELQDRQTMLDLVVEGEELVRDGSSVKSQIEDRQRRSSLIPDTDLALSEIKKSDGMMGRVLSAETLYRDVVVSSDRLTSISQKLAGMPDTQEATALINQVETARRVLLAATDIIDRWNTAYRNLQFKQQRSVILEQSLHSQTEIEKAQDVLVLFREATKMIDEAQRLAGGLSRKEGMLHDKENEVRKAEKDRDDLLSSIKTCPLTLKPVSKECLF